MKNLTYILLLLPMLLLAQLPVTDVATNSQLVILNTNISTMNAQLTTMNTTLQSINSLLAQNVAAVTNTSQLTTQDMVAKRKSPTFLWNSPEMVNLLDLKDNILDTYKDTKNNISSFKHLEPSEISEADNYLAKVITKVSALVSQASNVAASPELVEPGLRMSTITSIVGQLNKVLDEVQEFNETLKQKDYYRRSIMSTINNN